MKAKEDKKKANRGKDDPDESSSDENFYKIEHRLAVTTRRGGARLPKINGGGVMSNGGEGLSISNGINGLAYPNKHLPRTNKLYPLRHTDDSL